MLLSLHLPPPSHDGQFAPRVKSLANKAQAQISVLADRLAALSDLLLINSEEFEAADLQTQSASLRPLAAFADFIGLGRKIDPALAEYLVDYIFLVQEPGLPSDGPITPGLLAMLKADSNGKAASLIGSEPAARFSSREDNVSFAGSGGAAALAEVPK
jgi:hypothetical protein